MDSVRVRPGAMEKAADAQRRELHVAHVRDTVEGRLGRGVGHAPPTGAGGGWWRGEGRLGEHVDQPAVPPFEHAGQEQLGEEQGVEVVAYQAALGQLERQVENAVHGAGPLVDGVVDQHIDPPQVGERDRRDTLDRRPVQQVHGHGQAGPPQRLDLRRSGVEAPGNGERVVAHQGARCVGPAVALVHRPGGDHDVEAAPGQRDRRAAADAPAGAGHEGDPPCPSHHIIPAIWCPPSTWSTCPFT